MTLYAMAVTGRFGLGHGLLAWGRSVVWANENNAKLIAPNWLQLRIGPYLRRERDKRFYYKLFRSGRQIGGLPRLRLLLSTQRLRIEEFPKGLQTGDAIVEFHNAIADNEAKYFHEIIDHSQLLREALLDMTRPGYRPAPASLPHIAVHIRGGDFGKALTADQLLGGGHNLRLPIAWYVEMIGALRKAMGGAFPAIVYSDCPDVEIEQVLKLQNCLRSTNRESITDMLAMAQAKVLVSSGSGFSRWGSYLGQVPRICYPGQRGVRVIGATTDKRELEPEVLHGFELPSEFIDSIALR